MPEFKSMQMPQELSERLFEHQKPRELYEVNWLTFIRPDRRDVTARMPGLATVRLWAQDADEAAALFRANQPVTLFVNGEDQELPILHMMSVLPTKPGISEESMLPIVQLVEKSGDEEDSGAN